MQKDKAVKYVDQLNDFCEVHGLSLSISNSNAHWKIYKDKLQIAQWWPGTSRLVLEKMYDDWIEVYDVNELITAMLSCTRFVVKR